MRVTKLTFGADGAAPPASGTNADRSPAGLTLSDLRAYRVTVAAPAGQALSTCTLAAWLWSPTLGLWARVEAWDLALGSVTGLRAYVFAEREVHLDDSARLYFVRQTATFSGVATEPAEAGTLTVLLEGVLRRA